MWAYRLEGPLRFERHEIDPPAAELLPDGSVLLKFRAGGVCGSDIARCKDAPPTHAPATFGWSLHEIVGEVVATNADLAVGTRVAGWVGDTTGLREFVPAAANQLAEFDETLDDVHAVALQPLACVLWAMSRLGDVSGARAAVIGLGPIGLLFAHALRDAGASPVVGVDTVDRSDVASTFGIDDFVGRTSRVWSRAQQPGGSFDVVVEAIGHQVGTMDDAITVTAPDGTLLYFGNPDDDYYPVRFGTLMDRNITLRAGRTPRQDRRAALERAKAYVATYPRLLDAYVTDVLPITRVQAAYDKASRPTAGQLKVVLDGSA
ncbi:MAG: zinc-binding dehydrogenase [Nitriliruptorales bacterium]|nr:zinc-binding dehydrogenase [Nitriliruptorales bacterium]